MPCFQWLKELVPCVPRRREPAVNRWLLITGCDSGFGHLLVSQALGTGFNVVAACYTREGSEALDRRYSSNAGSPAAKDSESIANQDQEALINKDQKTGSFVSVVGDLTTAQGISAVVAAVQGAVKEHQQFWAIVNNAGICLPGNVDWAEPVTYEKTFAVNFFAPVKLTYELLPLLLRSKGRVVNVTSVDGFIALPSNAAYNASKHALEAYSDTLRCEMRPWGIKVVVVEPSTMRTPLVLAYADSWLASFKAASPERREKYGDEWAQEFAERTKKNLSGPVADDPQITVDALLEALLLPDPPTRMTTGAAAKILWKPLSMLPDKMRDAVLYKLTWSGPSPIGLS
ncbi:RDH16 [Symbiodinium natans]|uniref:RDH16 protein n=1 Tax=Symbiodinium natans TaxID=878477 RepID=A0A812P6S1_9DINO|nr:RDH16 [Symbiodinium natans]